MKYNTNHYKRNTISELERWAKKDSPSLIQKEYIGNTDYKNKGIWYYILKYNSVNIFDYIIKENLVHNVFSRDAGCIEIRDYVKEILYFLLITNNLENINMFNFSDIGFADPEELSDQFLNTLMSDRKVSKKTIDYILTSHKRELFKIPNSGFKTYNNYQHGNVQILYPFLLEKAIDFKKWKFAKKVIKAIDNANSYIGDLSVPKKTDYSLSKNLANVKTKLIFTPNQEISPYTIGDYDERNIVYRYAINVNLDIQKKIIINKKYCIYKKIGKLCKKLQLKMLSERDIQLIKIDSSKISNEKKARLKSVNGLIIDQNYLEQITSPKYARYVIKHFYYNYYEYICDCLTKTFGKIKLFVFFTKYKLYELRKLLLAGKTQYTNLLGRSLNVFVHFTEEQDNQLIKNLVNSQNSIKDILAQFYNQDNSEQITKLRKNPVIVKIKEKKQEIYKKIIENVNKNKELLYLKNCKIKLVKTMDKNYFVRLLKARQKELYIIKLCNLFDSIIKSDYQVEGEDFCARINKFFSLGPCVQFVNASKSKYDVDLLTEWKEYEILINHLRMCRNNIAHAEECKIAELTNDELKKCLEFVFLINIYI